MSTDDECSHDFNALRYSALLLGVGNVSGRVTHATRRTYLVKACCMVNGRPNPVLRLNTDF